MLMDGCVGKNRTVYFGGLCGAFTADASKDARSILRFAFWLMTVTYSSSELSALSAVSMRVASLSLETQFRFLEAADADAGKSGGRAGESTSISAE